MDNPIELIEFRCPNCGKLLAKVAESAILEVKCPRCDKVVSRGIEKKPIPAWKNMEQK